MSAPVTDSLSSSISSSGHIDGLGRRALAFDRETGGVLERLHVRPELAVFEQVIRRRVSQVSTLEDERFARPLRIERDANGDLVVVSEFVTGSRLSDLLDVSADSAVVPGVDVALGYLLEALPALVALHTHGPRHARADRSVADCGDARRPGRVPRPGDSGRSSRCSGCRRTGCGRDFGVSAPGERRAVRRRRRTSRRSRSAPDARARTLAQAGRASGGHRSAPRGSHRGCSHPRLDGLRDRSRAILPAFAATARPAAVRAAEEALADVRSLVKHEIGLDVCRQALIDFIAQMDAAYAASLDADADDAADAESPCGEADAPTVAAIAQPSMRSTCSRSSRASPSPSWMSPRFSRCRNLPRSPPRTTTSTRTTAKRLELSARPAWSHPRRVHAEEVYDLAAGDASFADPAAVILGARVAWRARSVAQAPSRARQAWSPPHRRRKNCRSRAQPRRSKRRCPCRSRRSNLRHTRCPSSLP